MGTVVVEVLVLGAVVLLAVAAVASRVAGAVPERRHRERLAGWARDHGWSYDRERPELVDRFEGDPFVEVRSNARARHVLCARVGGYRVMAYEYSYTATRGQGRDSATTGHVHTVVAAAPPGPVPVLEVRARGEGGPGPSAAGVREVRVGDAAFDGAFAVWAADGDFARRVLDEGVRAHLLGGGAVPVPFRFSRTHVLTWQAGALDPGRAAERARALVDLLERVPGAAWSGRRDAVG
ncbi:hypothetical protein ACOQFV_10840 [Nocardiopsis changdeensis]|uniref:DUF3137 domain-containing protein n=1 Tax=Nocardiopsis changdeensis TaxID=2831969 RepID=A0ABX8BUQ4_9ACTN|nr:MULTISPECIES: hypothetical protein [Nocardiopsis]QUX25435.1 hypothetical protein KGD84_15030 [Nocardiopsis changdeensis]QYX35821.1 hypothetical protein K1J57_24485 [Nocardiopsis sp. MT53]